MEDEFDMDLGGDDDEAHCALLGQPYQLHLRNSLWMVVYAWGISSRISSPKKTTSPVDDIVICPETDSFTLHPRDKLAESVESVVPVAPARNFGTAEGCEQQ